MLALASRLLAVKAAEPRTCGQLAQDSCAQVQVPEDSSTQGVKPHSCRQSKMEYETKAPPSSSMVQRVVSESQKNVDEEHAENSNISLPVKQAVAVTPADASLQTRNHSLIQRFDQLGQEFMLLLQCILARFLPCSRCPQLINLLQDNNGGMHVGAAVILLPLLAVGIFLVILFLRSMRSEHRHDQTGRGRMSGASAKPWQPSYLHTPGTGTVGNMRSPRHTLDLQRGLRPTSVAGVTPPPIMVPERERTSLSPIVATPPQQSGRATLPVAPHHAVLKTCLCPELVVPENNECTLLLPEMNVTPPGQGASGPIHQPKILSIDDLNGMAVLFAAYTTAAVPPAGHLDVPGHSKRLVLRSALEDVVLASCADSVEIDAQSDPSLVIFDKADEQCAVLRASSPGGTRGFMVHFTTGQKVMIRRDLQSSGTYATDEDGWLLACTENTERGRVIRISPQQDAGLMTLAMLGTDLMVFGVVSRLNRPYSVF